MADIIELPNSNNIDYSEILSAILSDEDDSEILSGLANLLALEEEHFIILKDVFLNDFKKSINNPNDKISLVQSLNASGNTAEDLIESFSTLIESIEQLPNLSRHKRDFLKELFGTITNAINETEGIAKRYVQIPIELCHENAKIPQYANVSDSGMDVYALDDYIINPGETKLIPTGIKLAIPPGYEIQVRPKSGRALKTKLRIANTPGTIDAGYRDEIGVIVENIEAPIKNINYHYDDSTFPTKLVLDSIEHGSCHVIGKGEKFCQLVLCEVPKASLYRVESVGEIGEDRGGGFGSTGLT